MGPMTIFYSWESFFREMDKQLTVEFTVSPVSTLDDGVAKL